MKKKFLIYATFLLILNGAVTSCINVKATTEVKAEPDKNLTAPKSTYLTQAVLWQQNAAEYKALCYQAFSIAKLRLNDFLAKHKGDRSRLAIITDIDETVMDNSPYEAKLIKTQKAFSADEWDNWVNLEEAEGVPGAGEFLNYAKEKNVEVFYVSNRTKGQEGATIANMKTLNFPFADKAHLLFKDKTSSKKSRFEKVEKNHTIVLYMGDNLSDFSAKFRAPSTAERRDLADKLKDDFGRKFIVLPNPMYGDWDTKGIYQGRYDWTEVQKDSLRKESLNTY